MSKLVDFPCKPQETIGLSPEIIEKTGLSFPAGYNDRMSLVALALAVKDDKNLPFCMLPFCHTIEAEALGGKINLGNGFIGPRPKKYAYTSVEDLLQAPAMDFTKGRIHQVLLGCSILKGRGEKVVLEICGPYTIISSLMDLSLFFKTWRKDPSLAENLFSFIGDNLANYFKAACTAGVDIISYADPAGSLKILGPRYTEKTAHLFTVPFLQKASEITAGKALIHLCPKIMLILRGLDLAKFIDLVIPKRTTYAEAVLKAVGKTEIIGQSCLGQKSLVESNRSIKAIRALHKGRGDRSLVPV